MEPEGKRSASPAVLNMGTMQPDSFIYDGSFDGLLTAIFDIFAFKASDGAKIIDNRRGEQRLLAVTHHVVTDEARANRVWQGIKRRTSAETQKNFFHCYLSERPDREAIMLDFCRHLFSSTSSIEGNLLLDSVRQLDQIGRQVWREKHRFEAFVRFRQSAVGLYLAEIDPKYDVLPLLIPFFKNRYPMQQWLIYDVQRGYGIYWDRQVISYVRLCSAQSQTMAAAELDEMDQLYQEMWKQYYKSTSIAARGNRRLMLQHIPLRYWKYLPEKQQ